MLAAERYVADLHFYHINAVKETQANGLVYDFVV